jgi:hypothetical protein
MPYFCLFGGSAVDAVKSIAVDSENRLVMTGYTLSPDFPVTPGAVSTTLKSASGNAFVTRVVVDPARAGFADYSTFFGGSSGDVAYGIAIDVNGSYLLTGYTLSPDFPVTFDASQGAYAGGSNAFFTVLDPLSGVRYSTFLGQPGVHTGYGVAASLNGRMYVGGSASAAKVPLTSGAWKSDFSGGLTDGFVLVFNP